MDTINNMVKVANREVVHTREENYRASIEAFETLLATSPTTYNVTLKGRDLKRSDSIEACIVRETPERTLKNILYRVDDEISTGEYIYYNNEFYIAYERDRSTVGYNKRDIEACNNVLTFQDSLTGKVYEFPCIVGDKTSVYADGLAIHPLNIVSDDMISIIVPNNEMIASIPSYGYRFVFNNDLVYSTTRKDMLTEEGIISFRAIYELKDERDDLENNIAYQKTSIEINENKDESADENEPSIEVVYMPEIIRQNRLYDIDLDLSQFTNKEYNIEFYEKDKPFEDIEVSDKTEQGFKIKMTTDTYTNIKMIISMVETDAKIERLIETRGRWG